MGVLNFQGQPLLRRRPLQGGGAASILSGQRVSSRKAQGAAMFAMQVAQRSFCMRFGFRPARRLEGHEGRLSAYLQWCQARFKRAQKVPPYHIALRTRYNLGVTPASSASSRAAVKGVYAVLGAHLRGAQGRLFHWHRHRATPTPPLCPRR